MIGNAMSNRTGKHIFSKTKISKITPNWAKVDSERMRKCTKDHLQLLKVKQGLVKTTNINIREFNYK